MRKYIDQQEAEHVFQRARRAMKPQNYSGLEFHLRDNILLNAEQIIHLLPAADVVARDCYDSLLHDNDTMRAQLAAIGKKPGDTMVDVQRVFQPDPCTECCTVDDVTGTLGAWLDTEMDIPESARKYLECAYIICARSLYANQPDCI